MELRPIILIIGALLTVLSVFMLPPMLVDLYFGSTDWQGFVVSAAITFVLGVTLMLTTADSRNSLSLRQAFLMVNCAWASIALFGALPFWFSPIGIDFTDSFFEAMSGITTTGSTVITGLDTAPPGILLWRAILQWLGGIGIIVMALSVLPMLQVGGMQLFRAEGFEQKEKIMPRATEIAYAVVNLYLSLTVAVFLAYLMAGMSWFDALAHAMTSIATGGFSTSDQSLGFFNSATIDWIAVLAMIGGSLPFVLMLRAFQGSPLSLVRDSQVRAFMITLGIAVGAMALWLWSRDIAAPWAALRLAAFNVTSIMTGTGYATADYMTWGSFAVAGMLVLMFIGGCAGSTTCGIKVFRFQVLFATAQTQVRRLVQPNGIFITYYDKRPITEEVSASVMGFFFLFIGSVGIIAILLGATGLDLVTALSSAATAIANVGPGLGDVVGPSGSFRTLPDSAKWIMALAMLLGRLEFFTVLVMVLPAFWRG